MTVSFGGVRPSKAFPAPLYYFVRRTTDIVHRSEKVQRKDDAGVSFSPLRDQSAAFGSGLNRM
jgi:hypothetical protein